ncbi:MAG TPA: hypothetical protein VK867_02280 [Candidatus Limnocylindrales bacterium]|nr:hypothetical protein [Candidatus Limnocylindrales bacterium]
MTVRPSAIIDAGRWGDGCRRDRGTVSFAIGFGVALIALGWRLRGIDQRVATAS